MYRCLCGFVEVNYLSVDNDSLMPKSCDGRFDLCRLRLEFFDTCQQFRLSTDRCISARWKNQQLMMKTKLVCFLPGDESTCGCRLRLVECFH